MAKVVNVSTITLQANNKVIKPDENGYYRVVLSAFNVLNSGNEFYPFTGIKELLYRSDHYYHKRITAGRLYGEPDHPFGKSDATKTEIFVRASNVPVSRRSHHIKEVRIVETDIKSELPGYGNVVILDGLIKPVEPFGKGLKDSLDNPDEDTCFSIRCFSTPYRKGIYTFRRIDRIITWDHVEAPGISYASKLNGYTTESEDIISVDLDTVLLDMEEHPGLVTGESADARTLVNEMLKCGFETTTDVVARW